MKKKTEERPVYQVVLKHGRYEKLKAIADHRGVKRSSVIFNWIDAAYAKLPSEAK